MSADASLTFYGVRYKLEVDEVENADIRKHPLALKARAAGLNFYFASVGGAGPEEYYLYIGSKIGITGHENAFATEMFGQEVRGVLSDVDLKLTNAGFTESPKLYMQWIPDV
jgi:hypothetical protein